MEKLKKYPLFNKWTLVIVLFSFIQGLCLIHHGDDLYWMQESAFNHIFAENAQDQRYFTNVITHFVTSEMILRVFVYTLFTSILLIFTAKIIDGKKQKYIGYFTSIILFLSLPSYFYANTFNWISGFTNYIISLSILFLYIWFVYPVLNGEKLTSSKFTCIFTFILGFLGTLCVEHISIYNFCFGLFIIIYSFKKHKHIHLACITYLIAVIISLFLMFGSSMFISLVGGDHTDAGMRSFEFSLSDISLKLYTSVIPFFATKFWIIHLIISISVYVLYCKLDRSSFSKKKLHYSKAAMLIVIIYTFYSIFSSTFISIMSLTYAYRVNAIETALVFLYIISLVYLSIIIFDKYRVMRICLYIISAVFLTAPFLFVNPVSPRCFFADYVFWILIVGEILMYLFDTTNIYDSLYINKVFSLLSVLLIIFISYINVSNKICDNIRVKYIHQQLNEDSNTIEIIKIPYSDYSTDVIYTFPTDNEVEEIVTDDNMIGSKDRYFDYYKDYIGVDDRFDPKDFVYIPIQDYFMNH